MSVRIWDKKASVFWNVLSIDFDEQGKVIHFYAYRWKDNKKVYIDLQFNQDFELRIEP